MKTQMKEKKGITLIALVITIIVLLILAGVTIATLTGDNGLLTKAGNAKNAASDAEIEEQIKLAYSEWQLGQYTGVTENVSSFIQNKLNSIYGAGTVTNVIEEDEILTVIFSNGKEYLCNISTGKLEYLKPISEYPKISAGEEAKENSRYISDGKTAIIPAGYIVSDVKEINEETGKLEKDETAIDNGLVITKDGNEYVWIPVENVTDLYIKNTLNQEWNICGTSGNNKVVTKYASKSEILSGQTRTTPGITTSPYYREPDIIIGNGSEYDAVADNRKAAGFVEIDGITPSSLETMAKALRNDYINMINSVRRYGGFYVGRYELSNVGTQKNQPSLTSTNWYNLYKKCKGIDSTNAKVETRMIWGCQWDQVCKFISSAKDANGDSISLTDSSKYGNYCNSQAPANTGNYEKNGNYGVKKNTGSNEAWKTNNIYDLAGNCYEWTQEAYSTANRARRGGGYLSSVDSGPVTFRGIYGNTNHTSLLDVTTRIVLFIK